MFHPVESSVSFPKLEEEIIQFWKERRIYEKSLAARAGAPPFVFYEGPPTANGLPHPGHCLTRAIKDLFPRYRTMRGYRCERKAGWDTHGLPVEVEVCKELGIHSKEEIEAYGVEPFIHKCLESVFRYTQAVGAADRAARLLDPSRRGLRHLPPELRGERLVGAEEPVRPRPALPGPQDRLVVGPRRHGAVSSGEVGQGYREVADPSVYVRFPLVDASRDTDLLVWTTTPWTLPSNHSRRSSRTWNTRSSAFEGEPRKLIVASALVETIAGKVEEGVHGRVDARAARSWSAGAIVPPFDYYYKTLGQTQGKLKRRRQAAHRLARGGGRFRHHRHRHGRGPSGPGLRRSRLRRAPGRAGPVRRRRGPAADLRRRPRRQVHRRSARLPGPLGQGRRPRHHPRSCRAEGMLFHQEQYLHDYPFCWRAEEDPLIQYPRKSWFIRTTQFKDQMLANNRQINWLPEHIRDGRFGNFLETNVDWALSRERYWGTPLPIWVCEETGHMEAVASYDELLAKPGVAGHRGLGSGQDGQPRAARRPARSTSPTSTRSPTIRPRPRASGCAACPR